MRALVAIARNTFLEAIRDKVLYLFLGFAMLLIVCSKMFGMLTIGDEGKIIKDLGLAAIQFFAMLISIMMSMLLISREVDARTVFNILSKPVRRWQFVLGKYLGMLVTIGVNLAMMTAALVVLIGLYQKEFAPKIFFGAAMIMAEMVLVAALATLFAVLTRPLFGSLLTLVTYVIGHVSDGVLLLRESIESPLSKKLLTLVYYVLPNLETFNFKVEVVHDLRLPLGATGWALCYCVLYTVLVLCLACLAFSHKDL